MSKFKSGDKVTCIYFEGISIDRAEWLKQTNNVNIIDTIIDYTPKTLLYFKGCGMGFSAARFRIANSALIKERLGIK